MVQPSPAGQDEQTQQALSYMRYQGAKSVADLAHLMERTAEDCARCLEGISEVQASFKVGTEWSVREVLGHMLDSGAGVNRQIERLAAGQPPSGGPGALGVVAGADRPFTHLRDGLIGLLGETTRLVASLPEAVSLEHSFAHPIFGPLNSKEWIAFQRIHALDHVQQIENIKAAPGYPKS